MANETPRSGSRPRVRLPRVLLVDDDDDNRELYALVLERAGFEVDRAATGAEAIERLSVRPSGIVLMDLAMPEMDGFEATRQIRADPSNARLRIIAFTCFDARSTRERALAAGCDDFLVKPCEPRSLVERVSAVAAKRRCG